MTNFLVNRLKPLPKMSAMSVQLMMITLYGMLKSGVAKSTSKVGEYILWSRPSVAPRRAVLFDSVPAPSPSPELRGTRTAGGRSQPRCASGGCSVYRKNGLITSIVSTTLLFAGSESSACRRVGRAWGTGGVYEMILRRSSGRAIVED